MQIVLLIYIVESYPSEIRTRILSIVLLFSWALMELRWPIKYCIKTVLKMNVSCGYALFAGILLSLILPLKETYGRNIDYVKEEVDLRHFSKVINQTTAENKNSKTN